MAHARAACRLLLGACSVLACLALSAPRDAAAEEADDATRVHVLLVIDSNDPEIGTSVETDLGRIRKLVEWGLPEPRRSVVVLQGNDVTPQRILAHYEKLEVRPTETVFFYYAGHGAWYTGGHYLRMQQGKGLLERKDLLAAIAAKKPRLAVVLTDCCSTYVGATMFVTQLSPDPSVFRDLFFRHRGVVDVTAAQKGQVAVGDEARGGAFTAALWDVLTEMPRATLDANEDGVVSWAEMMHEVSKATQGNFSATQPRGLVVKGRRHEKQTPHVFGKLADPPTRPVPPSKLRLGVDLKEVEGGGVEIVAVRAGSPAAWIGFRVGERIVSLWVPTDDPWGENVEIKGLADLRAALGKVKGPRVVTVTTTMKGETFESGTLRQRIRYVRLSH
jgi:hypothetical protein